MEGRSKRADTVRPPHDEYCERQLVCDSALNAKSDMNDTELRDETNGEYMEDEEAGLDDGSAAVRNIGDPGQPSESERREHMNTHTDLTDNGASSV